MPAADLQGAVPTGNVYDKYSSSNAIERRLMRQFFSALDSAVGARTPARVLEVGLGEGEVSARLRDRLPGAELVGIDLPDPGLARSWESLGLVGAFADVTRLPFPSGSFDLVLAIEVLEHVADPEAAMRELRRVGRDRFVLSVPREPVWRVANIARGRYVRQLGNTPGHVNHWSKRGFAQLVGRHLHVESVRSPFPWTLVAADR
jgi:ubiquinone/menaquinone biosynthesis C-methylase UbiE